MSSCQICGRVLFAPGICRECRDLDLFLAELQDLKEQEAKNTLQLSRSG